MVKSTSTEQPVNQDAKYTTVMHILEAVLVLVGVVLVALSVLLPILMVAMTAHGGVSATFISRYLRASISVISNVSMASSFIVATMMLSFEKAKANAASVLFGFLTLLVFTAEISLSLYLSLVRALTAITPTLMEIYALIGLVPLGLGCTMFTLASIMSAQ